MFNYSVCNKLISSMRFVDYNSESKAQKLPSFFELYLLLLNCILDLHLSFFQEKYKIILPLPKIMEKC